jgi:hypothetical protein
MKRIHKRYAEVRQRDANSITAIVQEHLDASGVSRTAEMSDEARIRLNRDLRYYRETVMSGGPSLKTRQETWREIKRNTCKIGASLFFFALPRLIIAILLVMVVVYVLKALGG